MGRGKPASVGSLRVHSATVQRRATHCCKRKPPDSRSASERSGLVDGVGLPVRRDYSGDRTNWPRFMVAAAREIGSPNSWVPNFERAGLSFVYVEHDVEQSAGPGEVNIEWGISGTNAYLPMRSLDENDEGRLKAFRKIAREGLLPPVFLVALRSAVQRGTRWSRAV